MSQYGWDTCPTHIKAQVQRFTHTVPYLLADNLIGIYLHGSLAMGCFNPQQSDLDLLVITQYRIGVETKRHLAELLLSTSLAPRPIEISFVVHGDLAPWRYPTPYDFHYSETWRRQVQEDLATDQWQHWNAQLRTDPDLAAHVTITRQSGVCLQGTPIAHAFPEVPRKDYLASILADVKDALVENLSDPVYAILNACRVYAFVHEGHIYSKQEGGLWALNIVPEEIGTVIALALDVYATDRKSTAFDPVAVARFVAYMNQKLPL